MNGILNLLENLDLGSGLSQYPVLFPAQSGHEPSSLFLPSQVYKLTHCFTNLLETNKRETCDCLKALWPAKSHDLSCTSLSPVPTPRRNVCKNL